MPEIALRAYAPWLILVAYFLVTLTMVPWKVNSRQFFGGTNKAGGTPGMFLLVSSAVITWIFGKSIANASHLAYTYGVTGGIGYALYYLSFITAGITLYFIRKKQGFRSISEFILTRYGLLSLRVFQYTIAFRLFNEVWSNTKVAAVYFGSEGSGRYWLCVLLLTAFTVFYSLKGGLRSSLLTDALQMIYVSVLLGIILILLGPGLVKQGLPQTSEVELGGGLTFCLLALVQVFSYPFHDPVLTDRAFITPPKTMLRGFILAGLISGSFIFLYSTVGLYGKKFGITGDVTIAVPAVFGLAALMIFNAILLASSGSAIDSAFTSVSKLSARDWSAETGEPTIRQVSRGRIAIVIVALLGNLPLLTVYLGDKVGPAIIAATTISGTMVMGLAPIFILSFIKGAGRRSFHLAFWPGVAMGVLSAIHSFFHLDIFPPALRLGSGAFAQDLGLNVYGLVICTAGFLIGVALERKKGFAGGLTVAAKYAGVVLLCCLSTFAGRAQGTDTVAVHLSRTPRGEQKDSGLLSPKPNGMVLTTSSLNLRLSGGIYLYDYLPLPRGEDNNFNIYAFILGIDASSKDGKFGLHTETRFRDNKLRPFYTSTVWFQEAYAFAHTKFGDVHVGKFYRKVGFLWDGSFFGNIQYFNGLKLVPDFGAEWVGKVAAGENTSWDYSVQLISNNSGTDGALNGRDIQSDSNAHFRNGITGRLAPTFRLGKSVSITPGISALTGGVRRTVGPDFQMNQVAGELTIAVGKATLIGEVLRLTGEADDAAHPLSRPGYDNATYYFAGVRYAFCDRLTGRFSYSQANYEGARSVERELLPGVVYAVGGDLSLIVEYNYWNLTPKSQSATLLDNSFNFVVHYSF
jgi:Na+/proline symporter